HIGDFILQKPLVDIYDHIWHIHPKKRSDGDAENGRLRPTPPGPRAQPGVPRPAPIAGPKSSLLLRTADLGAPRLERRSPAADRRRRRVSAGVVSRRLRGASVAGVCRRRGGLRRAGAPPVLLDPARRSAHEP